MVPIIFCALQGCSPHSDRCLEPQQGGLLEDGFRGIRPAEVQLCQGTLPGWGQLNPQWNSVYDMNIGAASLLPLAAIHFWRSNL